MHQKKYFKGMILLAAAAFIFSGCATSPAKPGDNFPDGRTDGDVSSGNQGSLNETIEQSLSKQGQVKKFSNSDELAAFLEDNAVQGQSYYGGGGRAVSSVIRNEMMKGEAADSISFGNSSVAPTAVPSAPAGMDGASSDYSQTNNQVQGVDEADIVKTDGKYIYTLSRNSVFIVAAYPAASAEVLAKIEFKSRPLDMFVDGDRLIVFGADDQIYKDEIYSRFRRQSPYAFLKIFDIADRKNPKQVRDLDFEGSYQDARLIGDNIYFITNNYNYYYVAGEPATPRLIDNGAVLPEKCVGGAKCFSPNIYYFNLPYSAYNFTNISVVSVKDENKPVKGEVYLLSAGQNLYVSKNNIYITYTKYVSEYQLEMDVLKELIFPRLSLKDQEKIKEIGAVKSYILSPDEKAGKINVVIERYAASLGMEEQKKMEADLQAALKKKYEDISKELEKTVIHRIAIGGGQIEYQASGEVTGNVLNQFSMDENDGYFRIATTKNRTWLPYYFGETDGSENNAQFNSYSNLYVLNSALKIVGSLENIEPGERIYSVRFMQNRAYLVTFQQTDPLFAIDLSNPSDPKILGKLKVPGYSSYLHPYSDKLLIGLGKNTVVNQWGGVTTKGLKISLYDVSSVADPKEIDIYSFPEETSDSIALNDHKAFLFSAEKNLLVIPYTANSSGPMIEPLVMSAPAAEIAIDYRPAYRQFFSGAAVFKITEKGFELRGKISHPEKGAVSNSDCWRGYCYYDNNILRSLFIGDTLYTFSTGYLGANNLTDLKEIKSLELKKERGGLPSDIDIVN